MMSKLQHVINHMDMYCILKETFLVWKEGSGVFQKAFVILILKSKEYHFVISIVFGDCQITRC